MYLSESRKVASSPQEMTSLCSQPAVKLDHVALQYRAATADWSQQGRGSVQVCVVRLDAVKARGM